MSLVIVIPELRQLPPSERWRKLVAPLAEGLEASGLGRVLELDNLRREASELGRIEEEELAVELFHFGYGRELVKDLLDGLGIVPCKPITPRRWADYHCEDYFADGWAEVGHFDETSQTRVIFPLSGAYEDTESHFLFVGNPGCDGIGFGYRKGHSGLWAFYPMGHGFKIMAGTARELVEGWCSGRFSV